MVKRLSVLFLVFFLSCSDSTSDSENVDAFVGKYIGFFSGSNDDGGAWSCEVKNNGKVIGQVHSESGNTYEATGKCDGKGNISLGLVGNLGAEFSGKIDGNNEISGTWENKKYNATGTFSGKLNKAVLDSKFIGIWKLISGNSIGSAKQYMADGTGYWGELENEKFDDTYPYYFIWRYENNKIIEEIPWNTYTILTFEITKFENGIMHQKEDGNTSTTEWKMQ